jgi:hypothetical protein
MPYSNSIQATISLNTASTTKAGFGTPLFVASHSYFADRIRSYPSTAEMLSDGFLSSDPAYVAAQSAFSQKPSVPFIKIGRRQQNWVGSVSDVANVSNEEYKLTITLPISSYNKEITYVATGGNETQDVIVEGLLDLIEADSTLDAAINVSMVQAGAASSITLTAKTTDDYFEVSAITGDYTGVYTASEAPAVTLAAIDAEDNDYYFICAEDHTDAYVTLLATEAETRKCLYFFATYDFGELAAYSNGSNNNVTNVFKDAGYNNTVALFHQAADQYIEMGYVGVNAPFDAGSVTWANVSITGGGSSTNPNTGKVLSSTYKTNLHNKNVNYVELDNNNPYVRTGVSSGGEWIDTMRGVAWMENDLSATLKNLLINQKGGKVGMTEIGEVQVREAVMSSLQRAVNRNFINEDFTVTVPQINSLDPSERATRILENVSFTATLQGAIHQIFVTGSVSA